MYYMYVTNTVKTSISPYSAAYMVSIGSGNSLLPVQCQAITWTNVELLPNGPLGTTSVKFQSKLFIHENPFGNVVWETTTILSRRRWPIKYKSRSYGESEFCHRYPDSKVHGANMGPTWFLSAPDGPHVGPMNLDIRVYLPITLYFSALVHHRADISLYMYVVYQICGPMSFSSLLYL